jgi:hypothetical protein
MSFAAEVQKDLRRVRNKAIGGELLQEEDDGTVDDDGDDGSVDDDDDDGTVDSPPKSGQGGSLGSPERGGVAPLTDEGTVSADDGTVSADDGVVADDVSDDGTVDTKPRAKPPAKKRK